MRWRNGANVEWNGRQMTLFAVTNGVVTSYVYNSDGIRTQKVHYDETAEYVGTTKYTLDGNKIVAEKRTRYYDPVVERFISGEETNLGIHNSYNQFAAFVKNFENVVSVRLKNSSSFMRGEFMPDLYTPECKLIEIAIIYDVPLYNQKRYSCVR